MKLSWPAKDSEIQHQFDLNAPSGMKLRLHALKCTRHIVLRLQGCLFAGVWRDTQAVARFWLAHLAEPDTIASEPHLLNYDLAVRLVLYENDIVARVATLER